MTGINNNRALATQVFTWTILIGSAALAADLVAAGIDRQLQTAPAPFALPGKAAPMASLASSTNSDLDFVLRQPEDTVVSIAAGTDNESGGRRDRSSGSSSSSAKALNLKAKLTGTIVSGYYDAAVFEEEGRTRLVSVGESIEGATLEEIHSTWILMKKGSISSIIALDSLDHKEVAVDTGASDSENAGSSSSKADEVIVESDKDNAPMSMQDIRSQLNDTAKVGRQVRVIPKEKDGAPYGTKVEFRTSKNIMSRLGLQDDDIILSVNGSPTRSVEEMYQGYMTIRNADALEFNVDRGGSITTIRYDLAK